MLGEEVRHMGISESVRAALVYSGRRQVELAEHFDTSPAYMSSKISCERWSGRDLVRVAQFLGGRLCFERADGRKVYIDDDGKG